MRIVRNGLFNYGWRVDVPSGFPGMAPRYETGMDGYWTRWGARLGGRHWVKVLHLWNNTMPRRVG